MLLLFANVLFSFCRVVVELTVQDLKKFNQSMKEKKIEFSLIEEAV